MSLYIAGAQCKYADFKDGEDWIIFDENNDLMSELAKKFNVFIDRYCLNEEDYSFVILNQPAQHKCFYSRSAFSYDMTIKTSPDFDERACSFISALNKEPQFNRFHNLNWSDTKELYLVTS